MRLKISLWPLMATLAVAVAFDVVFDQCKEDESQVLEPSDLTDAAMNVTGCPGSFIRFDMTKVVETVGVFECEFELGGLLPALSMETMDAESLVTKAETPNPIVTCAKFAECHRLYFP